MPQIKNPKYHYGAIILLLFLFSCKHNPYKEGQLVKEYVNLKDSLSISTSVNELPNFSKPPLTYLLEYNGKFPDEIDLFETDPLKSRLIKLLGDDYKLLLSMEANLEIKVENKNVNIQGYEHKHYAFYYVGSIDVQDDVITIGLVNNTGVHLFSENEKLIPNWIIDWKENLGKKIAEPSVPLEPKKIGDIISVGNFTYLVNKIEFTKSVENTFTSHNADGVYLIVYLAVLNTTRESRTISNSMFKVFDSDGYEYETSENALTILVLNDPDRVFLLKDVPPKIPKKIIMPFEVPTSNDVYTLQVSGGFWTDESAKILLQN